jgi:hypothetical protein
VIICRLHGHDWRKLNFARLALERGLDVRQPIDYLGEVATSHSHTVWSLLHVARVWPSGEKSARCTSSVWPVSAQTSCRLARSQTLTAPLAVGGHLETVIGRDSRAQQAAIVRLEGAGAGAQAPLQPLPLKAAPIGLAFRRTLAAE